MNPDVQNLIILQDVELKIASLRRQINEIPIKIQECQAELDRLQKAHEQRVSHAQELAKKRRASEGEVDLMRARLSRFKEQLMSVKTNKEYTAMLHEIQMAEGQIRSEEDRILEIMEEAETLEQQLKIEEGELKSRCVSTQEQARALESSIPALEAEAEKLVREKEALESGISGAMLERYRTIAAARKGVAMAEAKGELCTACHVRIRPQVCADLLKSDNVYTCDSCSRILFARETG